MRDIKKTLNEMKEAKKASLTEATNDFDYEAEVDNTIEDKAHEIEMMHNVIMNMNNEDAYFGDWITFGPPDGSTKEDFIDIAEDEEYFEDVKRLFEHVYKRYHEDGLYTNEDDVVEFAHEKDNEYGLEPIQNLLTTEELTEHVSEIDAESYTTDQAKVLDELSYLLSTEYEAVKWYDEAIPQIKASGLDDAKIAELVKGIEEIRKDEEDHIAHIEKLTAIVKGEEVVEEPAEVEEITEAVEEKPTNEIVTELADEIDDASDMEFLETIRTQINESETEDSDKVDLLNKWIDKANELGKELAKEEVTESLGDTSDGWSQEVQNILEDYLNNADKFSYEITKTVRGAYTGVDTCEDLAQYIKDYLIQPLEEAADELEYDSYALNEETKKEIEEYDKTLDEAFEDPDITWANFFNSLTKEQQTKLKKIRSTYPSLPKEWDDEEDEDWIKALSAKAMPQIIDKAKQELGLI